MKRSFARKAICALVTALVVAPVVTLAAEAANPAVYGHRGGRRWAPENTLASFSRCVEHGYGIELDIHQCKSGELVVIHDENVARTTDGSGLVKDMTLDELRKLSAGKWFDPKFSDEKIPLMSEVLSLVHGTVPIQIEIKNSPIKYPGIEDALIKLLSTYKEKDSLIIISFDHAVLQSFHRKAPQYKIGFLDCAIPYDISAYSTAIGAVAWHAEHSGIRADDVESSHKAGLKVNVWTPNKPDEWQTMLKDGVDGIVTDDPQGLETFLKEHPETVNTDHH